MDRAWLDDLRESLPITEVVSGHYGKADLGGEAWAKLRGLPVEPFPPHWDLYGKQAGPIRNTEMAVYGVALVAFPGGTGTADMMKKAELHGLVIYDWRYDRAI